MQHVFVVSCAGCKALVENSLGNLHIIEVAYPLTGHILGFRVAPEIMMLDLHAVPADILQLVTGRRAVALIDNGPRRGDADIGIDPGIDKAVVQLHHLIVLPCIERIIGQRDLLRLPLRINFAADQLRRAVFVQIGKRKAHRAVCAEQRGIAALRLLRPQLAERLQISFFTRLEITRLQPLRKLLPGSKRPAAFDQTRKHILVLFEQLFIIGLRLFIVLRTVVRIRRAAVQLVRLAPPLHCRFVILRSAAVCIRLFAALRALRQLPVRVASLLIRLRVLRVDLDGCGKGQNRLFIPSVRQIAHAQIVPGLPRRRGLLLSVNGMRGTGAQQAEQRQQETHHLYSFHTFLHFFQISITQTKGAAWKHCPFVILS